MTHITTGTSDGNQIVAEFVANRVTFGVLGEDGTGNPWEHLDSWAYRNNDTTADGTFVIGNWTIPGANSLDGMDAAGINAAVPFGTFSIVPEPSSTALLGLGGLALILRRRK